jgi:threonylcarbamoyladenosine tRNA methylthiotransferase MtaB
VKDYVADGYREVVLTGTEIGDYQCDGTGLKDLLGRILKETGIARLRLSSLQPQHINEELLKLWREEKLCPHFHLSLQSGSDAVLARMRRRYTVAQYRQAVAMIREALPDAAVTTDVITGFPGETEAEFLETYEFCEETGFARIHVFPYSPRPGTAAADMPGRVADAVKRERSRRMLALAEAGAAAFRRRFLSRTLDVLCEGRAGGYWSGLTGNYIKVYIKSREDLTNELRAVRLAELYRDGVRGEIAD